MNYINPHKIHENLWRCDCGKDFKSSRSLASHARFCKEYNIVDKTSLYKNDNNEYVCECGKSYLNFQSFNSHLSHCNIHHKVLNKDKKLRPSEINHSMNWENKTNEEINKIRLKSAKTHVQKINDGIYTGSFKGKHHTDESKEKMRIAYSKLLATLNPNRPVTYNKNGCKYIDNLNKINNWNLQHAENGGEVNIKGYWLDGYDKDLNIAFEYDEPGHYKDVYNNILSDRDIKRQNIIIETLHCEFWRYNEKLNLLYKI